MSEERTADIICRDLERKILSGNLADDSMLPAEKDLCLEYGASRTVIREVITALTNRGMLDNRPRYRPIVKKPGFDDVLNNMSSIVQHLTEDRASASTLFSSRIFLERALVREAALHATHDDLEDLRLALDNNKQAINNSDDFFTTDVAFHRIFYRMTENPIFPALHHAYTQWLATHWAKMDRSPKRNQENYSDHQSIFEAVAEKDPAKAELRLEQHLQQSWADMKGTFEIQALVVDTH